MREYENLYLVHASIHSSISSTVLRAFIRISCIKKGGAFANGLSYFRISYHFCLIHVKIVSDQNIANTIYWLQTPWSSQKQQSGNKSSEIYIKLLKTAIPKIG